MPSTVTPQQGAARPALPPGDRPNTHPSVLIVGQQRKVPAQFDNAGQLTAVLAGLADQLGGGFIDGEHDGILQPVSGTAIALSRERDVVLDSFSSEMHNAG